jgi:hypothetical protein
MTARAWADRSQPSPLGRIGSCAAALARVVRSGAGALALALEPQWLEHAPNELVAGVFAARQTQHLLQHRALDPREHQVDDALGVARPNLAAGDPGA